MNKLLEIRYLGLMLTATGLEDVSRLRAIIDRLEVLYESSMGK